MVVCKLNVPLKACLRAKDGVTKVQLYEQQPLLMVSEHALAPALRQGIVQHRLGLCGTD
ncbi:hypothetical protein ACFFKC_04780 [Pseudoduganella danionis]|uniref:Uncharacterized protein n=1 Tax=Pseudoduganella danionis TaxID=1890295 RepID=A0ABW9SSW4_9BURK|nr:hypothetical protein [Pseudoduganella danionis]MTW35110.1 hypothetical protein [Pseudoduganella danionis]